jgi:hypothetical protein
MPSRVFLAPVEDAPHSEHALEFLLENVAHEGDVVHLLVVLPATHPTSAMAYGGPMVLTLISRHETGTLERVSPQDHRPRHHSALPRERFFFLCFHENPWNKSEQQSISTPGYLIKTPSPQISSGPF